MHVICYWMLFRKEFCVVRLLGQGCRKQFFCCKPGQLKNVCEWKRCEKVQVGEYFGESALLMVSYLTIVVLIRKTVAVF